MIYVDPIKTKFYCVDYIYMDKKMSAVYFNLTSAQSAFMKMVKRGVECIEVREWTP